MPENPLSRHPDAASRLYDGEAFIVVSGVGKYHILNPIGTRVWELIDGTRTIADIVEVICEEYDVARETAETDVRTFVDDLRRHQAVS